MCPRFLINAGARTGAGRQALREESTPTGGVCPQAAGPPSCSVEEAQPDPSDRGRNARAADLNLQ